VKIVTFIAFQFSYFVFRFVFLHADRAFGHIFVFFLHVAEIFFVQARHSARVRNSARELILNLRGAPHTYYTAGDTREHAASKAVNKHSQITKG
jgi:hypothetical protein